MVLNEDWPDAYPNEDAAMADDLMAWEPDVLREALGQWHEAFDGASDEQYEGVVGDFNPSYDPTKRFGGYRQWAEWVRERIEAELARRG